MTQFEYQILTFPMDHKDSLIMMQDALNTHGHQGWEVISITSSEFAHLGHTAFLKRKVSEPRYGQATP